MRRILFLLWLLSIQAIAQDAWVQLNDFPFETREKVSFSINGRAFVLVNDPNSDAILTLEYMAQDDMWEFRQNFPLPNILQEMDHLVNHEDNAFVVLRSTTGFNMSLFKYNIVQDQWTFVEDVSYGDFGLYDYEAVTFSIEGVGYVRTTANEDNFRSYDPTTGIWTILADYPLGEGSKQVGFTSNGKGYVAYWYDHFIVTNEFYEYDPATNVWTQKADAPASDGLDGRDISASLHDIGYVGMHGDIGDGKFHRYNALDDVWEEITSCPLTSLDSFSFVLNDQLYLGAGEELFPNGVPTKQVWRLDPEFLTTVEFESTPNITLFPNPANDRINVRGVSKVTDFTIIDMLGNHVLNGGVLDGVIEVSSLAKGIYILALASKNGMYQEKFMKQ